MTISNWNGSTRFTPAQVVAPRDVKALIAIVLDSDYPSPLRAIGELHSLNESIATDGTVLFMKHFNKISAPVNRTTVTVGAGVRMIDLNKCLKRYHLQLPVVPEIGNATAGSVACCGTKDSSLGPGGFGQISSTVVGVRIVTAAGQDVAITKPDELEIIRSSYGLLGIIHAVTFAVEPRKKVSYEYTRVKLDTWLSAGRPIPPPDSAEILGGADGFLGFLLPYRRELIVERRHLARRHTPIWALDRIRLWLRTFAWKTGARPFMVPLGFLPRRVRNAIVARWIRALDSWFLRRFFLSLVGRFAGYRADAMIDFKRPVSSYFDFTFWAFPVNTWQTVIPAYLDFCQRFLRRTGFRPALPTEVYFIRRDNSALLSFSADTDIFTLDMVNWTDDEPPYWRQMNRAFNDFAARHGARPLLNQTKELLPSVAKLLWTPAWDTLASVRHGSASDPTKRFLADPKDRFLTSYFRDSLP